MRKGEGKLEKKKGIQEKNARAKENEAHYLHKPLHTKSIFPEAYCQHHHQLTLPFHPSPSYVSFFSTTGERSPSLAPTVIVKLNL